MTAGLYKASGGEPEPIRSFALTCLRHTPGASELKPPRFRDAWFDKDPTTGKTCVVVLTRSGGGNRATYKLENEAIAQHPMYLRNHDDEFDPTYAHFWFSVPEQLRHLADDILKQGYRPKSLKEKMDVVMAKTKAGERLDLSGVQVHTSRGIIPMQEFIDKRMEFEGPAAGVLDID